MRRSRARNFWPRARADVAPVRIDDASRIRFDSFFLIFYLLVCEERAQPTDMRPCSYTVYPERDAVTVALIMQQADRMGAMAALRL